VNAVKHKPLPTAVGEEFEKYAPPHARQVDVDVFDDSGKPTTVEGLKTFTRFATGWADQIVDHLSGGV
jgi:hypothetical protein